MNPDPTLMAIATEVAALQNAILSGNLATVEEVGSALLDLAFRLGLPALFFADYLTDTGRRQAEAVADIAETAKLVGERMRGIPT